MTSSTPAENSTRLIELLEQLIADVREHGVVAAHWEIDAEDCGDTPYRYRIDTVIDRGVLTVADFAPFWRVLKAEPR